MFLHVFAALCLAGSEGAARTPPQRFDLRWAAQWLFGKRAPAAKAPAQTETPKGSADESDLSDARTEVRCRSAVFADPTLRTSGMTVRVVNGVAHLDGTTPTRWQRLRAEQLARSALGVVRVENALRVGAEGARNASVPREADAQKPPETMPLPAETMAPSPSATVVSRPKTFSGEDGLVVTTYSVRRKSATPEITPVEGRESPSPKAPTPGKSGGRLVPWDGGSKDRVPKPWTPLDPPSIAAVGTLADRPPNEPGDLAVQHALSRSPFGDRLSFARSGKDVVVRGAAPAAALLEVAQEISRIPGVGTVSIVSDVPKGGAR